ncbi:TMEM175 family protein [Hymenobacter psychrophilus]|uniref:TMEM175 family protein n=1 Tax=Hymenobacter psychrophilus TaxID=651662 RepID=UPI0021CD47C7|nr:TMEM175 family protein [Hymenobacter psychrophilus]
MKQRLEAFSDGVLAIIITIVMLEIKVPHGQANWAALQPLLPVFLSYVLSFVYVGIYWNNHHLMLGSAHGISGSVLWANSHLLFWLSLVPFATGWMGENNFAPLPMAAYGFVLLMASVAYFILQSVLVRAQKPNSTLARALGPDWKGKLSPLLYTLGIGASFWQPWLAGAAYVAVALMWLVPDQRFGRDTAPEAM